MKKKYLYLSIIVVLAFMLVIGAVSYAYFFYDREVSTIDLTSGSINIDFSDATNSLNATTIPMSDAVGKLSVNYLDFKVIGMADILPIQYEIDIIPGNGTINPNYVKVYLTDQTDTQILAPSIYSSLSDASINDAKIMYQGTIHGNNDGSSKTTTLNYRLRVWIDENYRDVSLEDFTFDIYMYAKNIDDSIS